MHHSNNNDNDNDNNKEKMKFSHALHMMMMMLVSSSTLDPISAASGVVEEEGRHEQVATPMVMDEDASSNGAGNLRGLQQVVKVQTLHEGETNVQQADDEDADDCDFGPAINLDDLEDLSVPEELALGGGVPQGGTAQTTMSVVQVPWEGQDSDVEFKLKLKTHEYAREYTSIVLFDTTDMKLLYNINPLKLQSWTKYEVTKTLNMNHCYYFMFRDAYMADCFRSDVRRKILIDGQTCDQNTDNLKRTEGDSTMKSGVNFKINGEKLFYVKPQGTSTEFGKAGRIELAFGNCYAV
mgnify:CR=1 FL=1